MDERFVRAQQLANGIITAQNEKMVGRFTKVLLEALDKKGLHYSGRNPQNKVVHVLNAGEACVGKILEVEITEANGTNLRGYYGGAPRIIRSESLLSASLPST
jgi:tRNA A37 methylthiotransferase MiaB